MHRKVQFVRNRRSENPRSKSQQISRRRKTLFKKAFEYCINCNSDLYMIIRTRQNRKIYTLNSTSRGDWPPSRQLLVSQGSCRAVTSLPLTAQDTYYPRPVYKTVSDLASEFNYDLGEFLRMEMQ
jgi:hypothetical protein